MTCEFPDELLSAFLDDELNPAERAQVQERLDANPADRQLLAELKALKSDVADLPPVAVKADFADRVVRAALAEAEKQNGARGLVSRAPPVERHFWRRWEVRVAATAAVALAACLFVVLRPWEPGGSPQPLVGPVVVTSVPNAPLSLHEQLVRAIQGVPLSNSEAVVLRCRVGNDIVWAEAFDAALKSAGIVPPRRDFSGAAHLVQEAYRQGWGTKIGNSAIVATDAVFIEAPVERLQAAFSELGGAVSNPPVLQTEGKLALGRAWLENRAEGEDKAQPLVHHLNASLFQLPKQAGDAANSTIGSAPTGAIDARQRVRVLILVEVSE